MPYAHVKHPFLFPSRFLLEKLIARGVDLHLSGVSLCYLDNFRLV